MSDLEQSLSALAHAFVLDVFKAVTQSSLAELQELSSGLPALRGETSSSSSRPAQPARPAAKPARASKVKAKAAKAVAAPDVQSKNRGPGRFGLRVEDYIDQLVEVVKGEPYGIAGGELRERLGITKAPFLRIAAVAIESKRIGRTGSRGGLYYFGKLLKLP